MRSFLDSNYCFPSFSRLFSVVAVLAGVAALGVAVPAHAQNTISLTYNFAGATLTQGPATFTLSDPAASTISLTSGVQSALLNIGTLTGSQNPTGTTSATINRTVSFSVNGAAATNPTVGNNVSINRFNVDFGDFSAPYADLNFLSSSSTVTLSNGGSLAIFFPANRSGSSPGSSQTINTQVQFTYTASAVATAPEPGSIGLIGAIARRRKTSR